VIDAIAAHYNATNPAHKLASFDSVNPATGATGDPIFTKNGCAAIPRPNGSSAGIMAVDPSREVTVLGPADNYCIDFAGSSRGTATAAPFDPYWLVWVGHGYDAVSWTTPNSGSGKPATLTIPQLNAIYSCSSTARIWNQVGGTSTTTILPVLPRTSSDARQFFLTAIGNPVLGSCVLNGSINIPGDPNNPVLIEEDSGVNPKDSSGHYLTGNRYEFTTAVNSANVLFPYSAADWIAQTPTPRRRRSQKRKVGPG
jgi:hypothetical protein